MAHPGRCIGARLGRLRHAAAGALGAERHGESRRFGVYLVAACHGSVAGRRPLGLRRPARRADVASRQSDSRDRRLHRDDDRDGVRRQGCEQRIDLRLLGLRDRRRRQPDAPERQRACRRFRGARSRHGLQGLGRPDHCPPRMGCARPSGQQRRSRRISADEARRRHPATDAIPRTVPRCARASASATPTASSRT